MAFKYLIIMGLLSICASANAEWFLRGSHNDWAATQMESAGAGTNTMQLNSVVFSSAGSIKFDRFGDWGESYGNGSGNVAVAAGTWDIKFFTDTKRWSISAPQAQATYHLRGTNNSWSEGTIMTRVGATDAYELCVNFAMGDASGGPRFKVDPNGGWGDAIPAADFSVSAGWVKVVFNSLPKVISVQQNLAENCGLSSFSSVSVSSLQSSLPNSSLAASSVANSTPSSIYHLRGTFNGWVEGVLMNRLGATDNYERCVNFAAGDNNGGPRFKIDPNGGWGDAIPAADYPVTSGWVKISFNSVSKNITTQQNLAANCGSLEQASSSSAVVSSSVASSSLVAPASIYHLRGTFNSWVEGTLMTRIGATDNYQSCVNFAAGDNNGGPRFKVDPNGGWGDAIPAADYAVTAGWVRVTFNSVSKNISTQQNLAANCLVQESMSSSSISSSLVYQLSSASSSQSALSSIYHVRGTFNTWLEGTLMNRIGTSDNYELCVNFAGGDGNGGPRFKIDPNGGWGDAVPAADYVVTAGWVKITFNSVSKNVSVQQNLPEHCAAPAVSSVAASSVVTSSVAASSTASPSFPYHIRGTFNNWLEGTLMKRVGTTDNYQYCVNFNQASNRFKVDPNGGWGDALPSADYIVSAGWVNILFNSATKAISVQQNLPANCGISSSSSSSVSNPSEYFFAPESVYHVRGDFNGWAEGALLMQLVFPDQGHLYQACVNFPSGVQRFRIDRNGGWGVDGWPLMADATFTSTSNGWTLIEYNRIEGQTRIVVGLEPRCVDNISIGGQKFPSPPDVGVPSPPLPAKAFVPIHIRGTNNAFAEGTLMTQIGNTDYYTGCIKFTAGDANGGPRFRLDPNGGWGDAVPATDANVPLGWVGIGYNSTTKEITKRTNMLANCVSDTYRIMGTQRKSVDSNRSTWLIGDFFELVDGNPQLWKICRNFGSVGDEYDGPRFRVVVGEGDLNSGGNDPTAPPTIPASGWTSITFPPSISASGSLGQIPLENITVTRDMAPNCAAPY